MPSLYAGPGECDPYAQDCPDGERCVPWADDGGGAWNSTRCSPVVASPDQLGETCYTVGGGVAGEDSCDIGLMCWDVDVETNAGTCIALCECGPESPTCAQSGALCSTANNGTLPLCQEPCDPLDQSTCEEEQACYGIGETFVCAPDASGADQGVQSDPCAYINACDPGLACVAPELVQSCPAGSAGCCTAFCALDQPNSCPGTQVCTPWFDEGAPAVFDDVGHCTLPG